MNEIDRLRAALASTADEVKPADLRDRAMATSHRLLVRRNVSLAATGAAVAVIALTGVVSLGRQPTPPPPGVSPSPLRSAPSPTTLPRPTESPAPVDTTFNSADVTIPSWGAGLPQCTSGRVVLTESGQLLPPGQPAINFDAPQLSDVDRDGEADYTTMVRCGEGDPAAIQVVAFRKTAGRFLPLGRVVTTGDVGWIDSIAVKPDGQVRVLVMQQYTDGGVQWVPHHWRTYAWGNGGIRQVDGPTSFPAHTPSVQLSLHAPPILFLPVEGGYAGELTITVDNTGDAAAANLRLTLAMPTQLQAAGTDWDGCTSSSGDKVYYRCSLDGLDSGHSRSWSFKFFAATPPGDSPANPAYAEIEQGEPYSYQTIGGEPYVELRIK